VARIAASTADASISGEAANLVGFVATTGSLPPKQLWGKPNGMKSWHPRLDPETKRFSCREESGMLVADDVQPGTYTFQVVVYRVRGSDGQPVRAEPSNAIAIAQYNFTVPDPAPPEGIDLGEIRLEPVTP
jgi:hypothetical protein